MRILKTFIFVSLVSACATTAMARDFEIGPIRIDGPVVRAMLPGAETGGGYLRLTNTGSESETLLSVTSPRASSVQFHRMSMANGVMEMREMQGPIEIPAHQSIEFKPSGNHLMFMKVGQRFAKGETIPATFTFAKAGSISVSFDVGNAAGSLETAESSSDIHMAGMDMSEMDMSHGMEMPAVDQTPMVIGVMKQKFETPDKPLTLDPVVFEGNWAIAGWEQEGRGGRVLLSNGHGGWTPILCSGDSLKDASNLEKVGLKPDEAVALVGKLADAEHHLDQQKVALFAAFEGTVTMGKVELSTEGHANHAGHVQ